MTQTTSAITAARRFYDERRCRDRLLGGYCALMGEPVWDMLLALFTGMHQAPAIGSAGHEPSGPEIAARCAAVLHRLGLVERQGLRDHNTLPLRLSPTGVTLMTRVVSGSAAVAPSIVGR